jgi:hypothetical protein
MSIFDIEFASLFGVLKTALILFVREKRDNNDSHYHLPMKIIVVELIKDDLWAQNMLVDLYPHDLLWGVGYATLHIWKSTSVRGPGYRAFHGRVEDGVYPPGCSRWHF